MSEPTTCPGCGLPPHQPDVFCEYSAAERVPEKSAGPIETVTSQPSSPEPVETRQNGYQPSEASVLHRPTSPEMLALVAVERLFQAVCTVDCVREETGLVLRNLGYPQLQDRLVEPELCDALQVLEQQLRELLHVVDMDGGACGRAECQQTDVANRQHRRAAFPSRVAEVVTRSWATHFARDSMRYVDVLEAAQDYDDALIAAYNGDPEQEAA